MGGWVVVVGSINVDLTVRVATLPRPGETVVNGTLTRSGGGKSANQACAAARFGATTQFVGAVGDDAMADEALASVAGEGIDVSRCVRLPDVPTAVALIMVDGAGENQIAVASGANGALDGRDRDRGTRRASSRRPGACCCSRSRCPTMSSSRPPRWAAATRPDHRGRPGSGTSRWRPSCWRCTRSSSPTRPRRSS